MKYISQSFQYYVDLQLADGGCPFTTPEEIDENGDYLQKLSSANVTVDDDDVMDDATEYDEDEVAEILHAML